MAKIIYKNTPPALQGAPRINAPASILSTAGERKKQADAASVFAQNRKSLEQPTTPQGKPAPMQAPSSTAKASSFAPLAQAPGSTGPAGGLGLAPGAVPMPTIAPPAQMAPAAPSAPAPTIDPAGLDALLGGRRESTSSSLDRLLANYDPDADPYTPHTQNIDGMVDDTIRDLLGPSYDTSEDEELIEEIMAARFGQNIADSRAGMAAMGLGASGALGALEGDIARQNALATADQIMGIRQDARDDQRSNRSLGLGAASRADELQSRQAQQDALIRALFPDEGEDGAIGNEDSTMREDAEDALRWLIEADETFNDPWTPDWVGERRKEGYETAADHILRTIFGEES